MGTNPGQEREGRLSPFFQTKRIAAAMPYIRGRILDVGCGGSAALARHFATSQYVGYELDPAKVLSASARWPGHRICVDWPEGELFDSVVALAVIEHVPDPRAFLVRLSHVVALGGRIILTTPSPRYRFVHEWGAAAGLFSREAADEHNEMLDRAALERICLGVGLRLVRAETFLFGANQLFVLEAVKRSGGRPGCRTS
jgi:SAM-dependent methyltransferase